jgi:hypothetical protein
MTDVAVGDTAMGYTSSFMGVREVFMEIGFVAELLGDIDEDQSLHFL